MCNPETRDNVLKRRESILFDTCTHTHISYEKRHRHTIFHPLSSQIQLTFWNLLYFSFSLCLQSLFFFSAHILFLQFGQKHHTLLYSSQLFYNSRLKLHFNCAIYRHIYITSLINGMLHLHHQSIPFPPINPVCREVRASIWPLLPHTTKTKQDNI